MNTLNDMRSYSRNWIKEFIAVYKAEECLWQTRHPEYNNQFTRNQAYDKLVEKLKEVEPNSDRAMVVRKVNSLRSAFRREYRKKCENHNYEPKLWYYDILLFIAGQSGTSKKVTNGRKRKCIEQESCYQIKIDPLTNSEEDMATDENDAEHEESMIDDEHELLLKREEKQSSGNQSVQILKVHSLQTNEPEIQTVGAVNAMDHQTANTYHSHQQEHVQAPVTHSIQSIPLSKEQLHAILNVNSAHSHNSSNIQSSNNVGISRNNDEFDAIGMNVASKLRTMNPTQRIIAEKLISDVLFNGQLDTLAVSSRISTH
ncbi:uncharacterized protein LOC129610887 [Condylostylus longicornis]|uniref:uncharacterized protein LOC129610887 n=1 Tax=Condylostylus longicornis TaxID=2530218 RepID=UPI00244E2014|nr:uncharacterized protein LOC129610887 [Condylostylus longicornis]